MGCVTSSCRGSVQVQSAPCKCASDGTPPGDLPACASNGLLAEPFGGQCLNENVMELPSVTLPALRTVIPAEYMQPYDEVERIKSLRELGRLGTSPDPRFHEIVSLVKGIFQVDLAAVSLVESNEICFWVKDGSGTFCGAPRVPDAFCAWIILPNVQQMIIVEDALEDFRFMHASCVVNPPHIRFYAGAPLISSDSGHRYGALFLMDYKPRQFAPEQYALLAHFAELITRELEREKILRWQTKELATTSAQKTAVLRALDCFGEAVMLVDTARLGWPVLYANQAFEEATGIAPGAALGCEGGFWRLFGATQVDGRDVGALAPGPPGEAGTEAAAAAAAAAGDAEAAAEAAVKKGRAFHARVALAAALGAGAGVDPAPWLDLDFKPAGSSDQLREDIPHIGVPSYIADGTGCALGGGHQYYFAILRRLPAGWPGAGGDMPLNIDAGGGLDTPPLSGGRLANITGTGPALPPPLNGSDVPTFRPGTARAVAPLPISHMPPVPSFHLLRPKGMEDLILGILIGAGINSHCYRGIWHGGHVAVKVLDCWLEPHADRGEAPRGELPSFALQEAVLSRSLAHPYIVATYEWGVGREQDESAGWGESEEWNEDWEGDVEGSPPSKMGRVHQQVWLIQSYSNQGTLFDGIERGLLREPDGSPKLDAILATAREVAIAMYYIHSKGVLHGDLTPGNVLLKSSCKDSRRWIAQVGDFGLSRMMSRGETAEIIETRSLGTITHMPPELLTECTLSTATDVYSFGCMLWEMFMGRRAWAGLSATQVAHAVSSGKTLPPLEGAPEWLEGLMWRCLNPDHTQRPSFEEIVEELDAEPEEPWAESLVGVGLMDHTPAPEIAASHPLR